MANRAVSIHEARYLLGLTAEADQAQVTRAYRRRARSVHPDLSTRPDAAARFQSLTDAYRVALGAAHLPRSTGPAPVPDDADPASVEVEADAGTEAVHHDPPIFLADVTGGVSMSRPRPPVAPVTAGPVVVRLDRAGGAAYGGPNGVCR